MVLSLAPVAAFAIFATIPEELRRLGPGLLAAAGLCYVLAPVVLAALLRRRHPAFLQALIGECVALLALALLYLAELPAVLVNVHYVFVVTMVTLAVLLFNRDLLFPLIFSGHRGFRHAPRFAVHQMVRVMVPRLGRTFEMMIEDCSLTGLALYGSEEVLEDMLASNVRGDPLLVQCAVGRVAHQVPTSYLWQSRTSSIVKIGLKARDQKAMAEMFHALGLRQTKHRTVFRLVELSMTPWIRRTISYGIASLMLLLMIGLPLARQLHPAPKALPGAVETAH